MRRRRLVLGLALLAGAGGLAVDGGAAGAADLAEAGWWSRLPIPAVGVEAGQLMVSGAPDGATAMAAVRYELDDDETAPVLTLDVASDQGGAGAVLAACVTGSAWTSVEAGAWDQKPSAACDQGSVQGVRAEDGSTWTFALGPLSAGTLLDVVVVPGVVEGLPAGLDGSTFSLVFEPPIGSSLTTTPGEGAAAPGFDVPQIGATTAVPAPSPPVPAGGSSVPPSPSATPFRPPAVPPSGGGFTPALPPEDQGLTATAPAVQAANPPLTTATPASATSGGAARTIGVIGLVLSGVAAVLTSRQPSREPRGLGPFAPAP